MTTKDIDSIAYLIAEAKKHNRPKPIVFLGAGASISAGIPAAGKIKDDILEKFSQKPDIKKLKAESTYYEVMACLNTEERHELLRSYITNDNVKINVTHIYLAQMLKEGYIDYILTVNFDDLILRACALFNFIPPVYDISILKDFTTTTLTEQSVTYLHGQHHGFWLLNTGDELKKVEEYIPTVFDRICNKRTWIVVGYSGDDPIFKQISRLGHFTNDLFWVGYNDHKPTEKVQSELLNKPNSNAYLLSGYNSDAFFLKLHSELKMNTPDIFNSPFSFLKELMGNIRDIEENTASQKHQKLFENVKERYGVARKQIEAAIKQYEKSDPSGALTDEDISRDQLKKEIIEATLKRQFDLANGFLHQADPLDEEIQMLLARMLNNWGDDLEKNAAQNDDVAKYQEAIEKFEQATQLNSNFQTAFLSWARVLADIGGILNDEKLFEESIEKYKIAAKIRPLDSIAYHNWGVTVDGLASIKKDLSLYNDAIEKYKQAIQLDPESTESFNNLSSSLINKFIMLSGDDAIDVVKEAKDAAQKAVDLGGDTYNLACCYALLNEKNRALEYLEDALQKKVVSIDHVKADYEWKNYLHDRDFNEILKAT